MKIKAGEWRKLGLVDRANKLIDAHLNNRTAYVLRKRKK